MRRAPNAYREDIHSSKLVGFQWIPHILKRTIAEIRARALSADANAAAE
jgi:hypothetical protein